jgi:hypothetical protein
MDKAELIAILERILTTELVTREGYKYLEQIVGGHAEMERHVAACNRRAAALTVAIELARVHL